MSVLCVAAIQLTSKSRWQDNLAEVERLLELAVRDGARLVVLPENVFLFNGKGMRALAESADQNVLLESVQTLAKAWSIYLVIGSHPSLYSPRGELVADGRVRQTCWVIDPDGVFIERYDKIHLFDVTVDDKAASYRESDVIEAGDLEPKIVEVDGFKVGLSICYDVRFPELYRALTGLGAELVLVPAAFTYVTGKRHWNILLSARAIENQCYVLGVNQCGWHNATRQTYGHSALYSPVGGELTGLAEEPGYFVFNINKDELAECRAKMPCLSHRRF
ncbi:carbon-nitrogen hydrolase family protein [Marinomonas transparens]|uniref:Carbon-nitrogen hydrolase family protein n=1 Tax=Marinomonas transparens TaxID=2795388 RepID=A0A934JSU6_9GAMM|nr:carbon-nitrogen hydrolase family protein [Marinomonas transparens]MBJ7537707.1 carbon-nitrogen hydrolase family protein [Marinomonas transparens]